MPRRAAAGGVGADDAVDDADAAGRVQPDPVLGAHVQRRELAQRRDVELINKT